jgi:secreted PhoX family phosphatase
MMKVCSTRASWSGDNNIEHHRPEGFEQHGVQPTDAGDDKTICSTIMDVIDERIGRRALLKGLGTVAAGVVVPAIRQGSAEAQVASGSSTLTFLEVPHGLDESHHVASGYSARVLIRWGDPLLKAAPPFDPAELAAAAQAKQFGYNADFLAYMPLPRGSRNAEDGLLCVNHEYTNTELMFTGFIRSHNSPAGHTRAQAEVELAAHGLSVVEVRKKDRRWSVVVSGSYNRRFTVNSPFRLSGPAAGHPRLRTSADPAGTLALGTLNNCAGGVTPWGTVLSAEENFNIYFSGNAGKTREVRNHRRYGLEPGQDGSRAGFVGAVASFLGYGVLPPRGYSWARHFDRFDIEKEPNEPNRFGWIVEYDPYDPESTPVKRTALGRFKHEGATTVITPDGRIAVYSGDDEPWEYVYRFVTTGKFNPNDRRANANLLDQGAISVARFDADGTLTWLPLVHGDGPLVARNGFNSQADVLIEARRAADLVGATPMDRPEDVEPNPTTGRVYVVLTGNDRRKSRDDPSARERTNATTPRPENRWGYIIELIPPGGTGPSADHAADAYRWEFFLRGGDPARPETGARYGDVVSRNGWLTSPDNIAFDPKGRLWIATDGMRIRAKPPVADGLYATDTAGPGRAVTRRFFAGPRGAELCGPAITPDGRTLFVAVQHPAEESGSTFDKPTTRWPDFQSGMPPRPAVVVITKDDGGEIGS